MNAGKIIAGVLVAIGLGGLVYWAVTSKTKPRTKINSVTPATKEQFDELYKEMKSGGGDMFDGLSDDQISSLRKQFVKNLSSVEAFEFIRLTRIKERSWSPEGKKMFASIFTKWTGKGIQL